METKEEIFEMNNGCICCTVRGDLIHAFEAIAKRKKKVDHVIIETTGLADPGPVAQTFFVDDAIKAFARLDGIVTLVDAKHVEQHLDDKKADGAVNEAEQQVAFADRLLLNKVDLVPEEKELARIEARLRAINAFAPIRRCTRSSVSVDEVLGLGGFDLRRALAKREAHLKKRSRAFDPDAERRLLVDHFIREGRDVFEGDVEGSDVGDRFAKVLGQQAALAELSGKFAEVS